jgi:hypothetical protein
MLLISVCSTSAVARQRQVQSNLSSTSASRQDTEPQDMSADLPARVV